MRTFRGGFFNAPDVWALFTETTGGGDPRDIDAPCNAPAKSPHLYLDHIAVHSDFFQYELAMPIQPVVATHPAVASVSYGMYADPFFGGGSPFGVTVYGQQQTGANVLLTHGLGYVPLILVAWNGRIVVGGTIVQSAGITSRRFASAFATDSEVGINWCGYSDTSPLPSINVSYQVLVFRTPAANPALANFSGDAASFQLGRGRLNSQSQYLRHKTPDETWLDFDLQRAVDLSNGAARVVTGGNVQSDPAYNGAFLGGGYVPVGV